MGQATFTLTGLPAEGEKFMTTADLGEFYGRLRAFNDDGTAEVTAKLAPWSGKVRWIKATISPPDPVKTPWDELLAESRMAGQPALEAPRGKPGWPERPAAMTEHIYDGSPPEAWMPTDPEPAKPEGAAGETLTGLPAIEGTGGAQARLTRHGRGTHAK